MNERYENYNADEVEIDLIDFLFYLMRRWKSLVAMVLLGAVLGGAFYMVKSSKTTEETIEEEYQPEVSTEENMKLAAQYRRLYEQQMDYNQHSIVMQMNPNQVYEGTLTYYLAAGEQTELLSQLYMNLIDDQTVLAEVKAAAGLDCDDQYIRELLSSSVEKNTDDNNGMAGNVVNTLQVVVPDDTLSKTIITYQIDYLDKETCEKMTTAFKNAVDDVKQQYVDTYGSYYLELAQSTVTVTVDQSYQDKQNTSAARVENYLAKLVKLEDAFSDTEMAYYQEKYLAVEQINTDNLEADIENGISVKDLVKWLVVGVFSFTILWGTYYFLKYLWDSSIRTLDEVKQMGLPIIGYLGKENENPTIIDRLEKKKNGSYDGVDYVAVAIGALSEENILISADLKNDNQLEEKLQQKINKIKVVNRIYLDSDTLEHAKKADGVIIIIRLTKTTRKELHRELEVCCLQKITVLGVIGIDER